MKARRHVALLVEDDSALAVEMQELLESLGYDSIHAETQAEAEQRVAEGKFCFALLDLEIKTRPDSIRARVEGGFGVLRTIRETFPRVDEAGEHVVQVIMVSGHGKDHRHIREAMRLKANDFICKPIFDASPTVADTIEHALAKSGRADHALCEEITRGARSEVASTTNSIAITGREEGQRLEILVRGRSVLLTPATFVVLLRLVKARLDGGEGWVHKRELGGTDDQGWRTMSRVKDEIAPFLPAKQPITSNDRRGAYKLHPLLEITRIDLDRLESNTEAVVRTLAAEIRQLRRS